jgi:hypothetical protein
MATSQLALPKEVCADVYATAGYEQSATNLAQVSLDTDMVFRDGYGAELAAVSGGAEDGLFASLVVPV